MSLTVRSAFPQSVFALMGSTENSATYALGWALDRSPALARLLVESLVKRKAKPALLQVSLQGGGDDGGFTDIEIRWGSLLHAIIEAKQGFSVPSEAQLRRYRPRLKPESATVQRIVSLSALPNEVATLWLPPSIDAVPVSHLSWGDVRRLALLALGKTRSTEERLWLRELSTHLEDFAAMNRTRDNMVFVVSLGSSPMRKGEHHTWIDVVEKDGSYFHPVGNRWPAQPPNYIGFRYRGRLQSVHHIESFTIANDVSSVNPLWCSTDIPHFIYKLGPAMRPPKEMRAGGPDDTVRQSARVWCAIDTLLNGEFLLLGKARDATKRREALD